MVKKPVILICILLLLFSMAHLRAASLHMSLLGGLNLSMHRENIFSSDLTQVPRVGYIFGGGLELSILPTPMAFEVDLMYETKGGTYLNDDYEEVYSTELDYLTIPILIKWINRARKKGIFAGLGPSFGIPMEEGIETTDIGIMTCFGIELNNFVMEARFNYGLTDIFGSESSKYYLKNMSGCLIAGIKINII